jgi:hypothetical protein
LPPAAAGEADDSGIGVHFTEKAHELTGVPLVVANLRDPVEQSLWAEQLGDLLAPVSLHPTPALRGSRNASADGAAGPGSFRRRQFAGQVDSDVTRCSTAHMRFTIEYWRDDWRGELLGALDVPVYLG